MSKEDDFNRILDVCIEALKSRNATISELLDRYPEYAEQLSPLLSNIHMLLEFKTDVLASKSNQPPSTRTLIDQLPPLKKKQGLPFLKSFMRIPVYITSLLVIILITTFGLYYAINNTIPGDALYQAKRNLEKAQLESTHDLYRKAYLSLKFANRRVEEMNRLIAAGKTDLVANTSFDYSNLILDAINYLSAPDVNTKSMPPSMELLIADQTTDLVEETTKLLASSDSPTTTLELTQDIIVMQTFLGDFTGNDVSLIPTMPVALLQPTMNMNSTAHLSTATTASSFTFSTIPETMTYTPSPTNTPTSTPTSTSTENEHTLKTPKPTITKRPTNTPRPTNTHRPTSKPTKTPKFTPKPTKTPKP